MGKELRRLLLGLLIVAIPAVFIFLGVRGFVVRNAVVTSHLAVVEAPIDGNIVSVEIIAGTYYAEPRTAVSLRNPRSDPERLDRLTAQIERKLRSIETQEEVLIWYDDTIADLQEELDVLIVAFQADIAQEREVVLSDIGALQARIVYLEKEAERAQRLQGSAVSEATLQAALADLDEARARLKSLQNQASRLQQRIQYLGQALLVPEDMDDAVALAAAVRELRVGKAKAKAEAAELNADLDSLYGELNSAQQAFSAISEAIVSVPGNIVIWEVFAEANNFAAIGKPLFAFAHCDERFAQATVDDSTTELIRPNHPVTVYLYGEYEPIEGIVRSIYGSAAHIARSHSLAASVHDVGTTDAIVLIEIEPATVESQQYRLCDIGRTAYVEFEGIGFLDPFLNRLW